MSAPDPKRALSPSPRPARDREPVVVTTLSRQRRPRHHDSGQDPKRRFSGLSVNEILGKDEQRKSSAPRPLTHTSTPSLNSNASNRIGFLSTTTSKVRTSGDHPHEHRQKVRYSEVYLESPELSTNGISDSTNKERSGVVPPLSLSTRPAGAPVDPNKKTAREAITKTSTTVITQTKVIDRVRGWEAQTRRTEEVSGTSTYRRTSETTSKTVGNRVLMRESETTNRRMSLNGAVVTVETHREVQIERIKKSKSHAKLDDPSHAEPFPLSGIGLAICASLEKKSPELLWDNVNSVELKSLGSRRFGNAQANRLDWQKKKSARPRGCSESVVASASGIDDIALLETLSRERRQSDHLDSLKAINDDNLLDLDTRTPTASSNPKSDLRNNEDKKQEEKKPNDKKLNEENICKKGDQKIISNENSKNESPDLKLQKITSFSKIDRSHGTIIIQKLPSTKQTQHVSKPNILFQPTPTRGDTVDGYNSHRLKSSRQAKSPDAIPDPSLPVTLERDIIKNQRPANATCQEQKQVVSPPPPIASPVLERPSSPAAFKRADALPFKSSANKVIADENEKMSPVSIFLGTWNCECVPMTVESLLCTSVGESPKKSKFSSAIETKQPSEVWVLPDDKIRSNSAKDDKGASKKAQAEVPALNSKRLSPEGPRDVRKLLNISGFAGSPRVKEFEPPKSARLNSPQTLPLGTRAAITSEVLRTGVMKENDVIALLKCIAKDQEQEANEKKQRKKRTRQQSEDSDYSEDLGKQMSSIQALNNHRANVCSHTSPKYDANAGTNKNVYRKLLDPNCIKSDPQNKSDDEELGLTQSLGEKTDSDGHSETTLSDFQFSSVCSGESRCSSRNELRKDRLGMHRQSSPSVLDPSNHPSDDLKSPLRQRGNARDSENRRTGQKEDKDHTGAQQSLPPSIPRGPRRLSVFQRMKSPASAPRNSLAPNSDMSHRDENSGNDDSSMPSGLSSAPGRYSNRDMKPNPSPRRLNSKDGKKDPMADYDNVIIAGSARKMGGGIKSSTKGKEKSIARSDNRLPEIVTCPFVDPESISDTNQLQPWIVPGYDIYVIGLQESSSFALYSALTAHVSKINKSPYELIPATNFRISGRGDGAYLSSKHTTLGCVVRSQLLASKAVEFLDSACFSFHYLNPSKGAIFLVLNILGQRTCFIGCHLPPGGPKQRQICRNAIRAKMFELFGQPSASLASPPLSLDLLFHHIFWCGDFNFRLRSISGVDALQCIKTSNLLRIQCHDEAFDSLWCSDLKADNFEEGKVTFAPTYKKIKGRPSPDLKSPFWADLEYSVMFRVQWYKGRKLKERVPSWTDRIMTRSHPSIKQLCQIVGNSYGACATAPDQSMYLESDHSPVRCGFIITPPAPKDPPLPNLMGSPTVIDIRGSNSGDQSKTTYVSVDGSSSAGEFTSALEQRRK